MLTFSGHTDMENYRKECDARDRASLEYRRKEARIQRLEECNDNQRIQVEEQRNQELETLARIDVREYFKSCKNHRRMSLALRAKESRRHTEWVRRKEEEEQSQRLLDERLRARDSRNVELARQKEKRDRAIDALKHAECTFSSFPPV